MDEQSQNGGTDGLGPAVAGFDRGLLSPVTSESDLAAGLDDAAFARALASAELALIRAWAKIGVATAEIADAASESLGFVPEIAGDAHARSATSVGDDTLNPEDLDRLVRESASGGNPVIPLVAMLRERVPEHVRPWVHQGATSQDIMDTALMLVVADAASGVLAHAIWASDTLGDLAEAYRDRVAAARTLTQHAVPTSMGLRFANWKRGLDRAAERLWDACAQLPAQLGGAGGTLAAFVEVGGADAAARLPGAFAAELGLEEPMAPWHTTRWPVTELADALVQVTDALGAIAADVATLSRTEIGELTEGVGGGSSAMPQKHNPARAVLIRSAAIRAPHLAATLHTAAALAVDERPDGAWHAEWPTLRELVRIALGAAVNADLLLAGLVVDEAAVDRNLRITRGLIVAERIAIRLGPILGSDRVTALIAAAGAGEDLAELLRAEPAIASSGIDIDELLDPAHYTGLAGELVNRIADSGFDTDPASDGSDSEEPV